MAEVSESAVRAVLEGVIDPASGKSVVALGMVSGVATRAGHVAVTLEVDPARLVRVLHFDGTPITARFITRAISEHVQRLTPAAPAARAWAKESV